MRLAQTYGVSRTPLREALRLLEREGMIISERNRRSRVATLGVGDLEQIYALRITLEGFGIRLTAPMLTGRQRADARILLSSCSTAPPAATGCAISDSIASCTSPW